MEINGKGLGLAGSIVSIVFSILGFIFGVIFIAMSKSQDFIDGYTKSFLENGNYTMEDALNSLEGMKKIVAIFEYSSLIFLILGIIALILAIIVKQTNIKSVGIVLLVISILHLIGIRLLSFVLLLISSIQLLSFKFKDVKNEPAY